MLTGDLEWMILRSPGDIINVLRAVLGLNDQQARAAVGKSAEMVVKHGHSRRNTDANADHLVQVFRSRDSEVALLTGAVEITQGGPQPSIIANNPSLKLSDENDGFIHV